MNSDGISPLSSESDGVLQAGHNGQQGNLLPLLCVRVIRQREGIVRETGLDLQHGTQVATDIVTGRAVGSPGDAGQRLDVFHKVRFARRSDHHEKVLRDDDALAHHQSCGTPAHPP